MNIYRALKIQLFEWKYQRLLGILPLALFCMTLFVVMGYERNLHTNLQTVQTLYLPWISWSAILYFQPLYDKGAYHTLVPHYRKWFGFHFIFVFILYFLGYLILLISTNGAFHLIQMNPIILVHHVLLLFLYWMIGAGLLLLTKSFEYAAALVLTYTLIEAITRGEFMPWPHVFQFNEFYDDPIYVQKVGMIAILCIIFSMLTLTRLFKRA